MGHLPGQIGLNEAHFFTVLKNEAVVIHRLRYNGLVDSHTVFKSRVIALSEPMAY